MSTIIKGQVISSMKASATPSLCFFVMNRVWVHVSDNYEKRVCKYVEKWKIPNRKILLHPSTRTYIQSTTLVIPL